MCILERVHGLWLEVNVFLNWDSQENIECSQLNYYTNRLGRPPYIPFFSPQTTLLKELCCVLCISASVVPRVKLILLFIFLLHQSCCCFLPFCPGEMYERRWESFTKIHQETADPTAKDRFHL